MGGLTEPTPDELAALLPAGVWDLLTTDEREQVVNRAAIGLRRDARRHRRAGDRRERLVRRVVGEWAEQWAPAPPEDKP